MVGQAMLFLQFSDDRVESFKSEMHEAARQLSGNNISFLIGDVSAADRAFQVVYSYELSSLFVKYS
jgi:protein disulfide-isomerase A1